MRTTTQYVPHRKRRRKGYVLLMTMLAIALSSLALVGFASFSLNHAVETRMLKGELQQKWGAASIERVAFANSDRLLNRTIVDRETGEQTHKPLRSQNAYFLLGEFEFAVSFEDESAKLDLNQVLKLSRSEAATESIIAEFVDFDGLPIFLRPLDAEFQRTKKEDALESWGQVFELSAGNENAGGIRQATRELTCWSSKMNYRTASDETLYEFCSLIGGQTAAGQLVSERQRAPELPLEKVLEEIHISKRVQASLQSALVESSHSQSVWIRGVGAGTKSDRFVVRESISGTERFVSFQW